jgi:NADH:ubiquinone reductase (H+-translocating)
MKKHILIVGGGYVGMYTAYRLQRLLKRKLRVVADRTLALVFRREIVSTGEIREPRAYFLEAAGSPPRAKSPAGTEQRTS